MKVVIVGGVAGGASAAARLRRLDEKAEIVILERGGFISYANCGLPYYIGGKITEKRALTLQTPESFHGRFGIDVRIYNRATRVNREAKTVSVQNMSDGSCYEESYDRLILSPGAEPMIPPISGVDNDKVFTLRNIPDTYRIKEYIEEKRPETAMVVGGGYIGLEMAENLAQAGIKVTVAELAGHVIAPLDQDMACEVQRYLRAKGIGLLLKTGVTSLLERDGRVEAGLSDGENKTVDFVILSAGVRPETALAKEAGLQLNGKGAIVTDGHMRTSDPSIYAVGDAVAIQNYVTGEEGYIPLAGPANKQGRIAADNICGIESTYRGTQGSSILKLFDMTIAATGLNEQAAGQAGLRFDKLYLYSPSHATYYPGASNMTIKTVFEKETGRILGAQIVGFEGVDKRIDVLATAIRGGMTAHDLTDLELAYAPPFSSAKDPVNMTGYAIENILTGKVKQYHWHDIQRLPKDGSIIMLDVRTDKERKAGYIPGTIHIPLDDLREHLQELDPGKPIYVNCLSGLRSYIACRILTQNGFDCYNLSGGYRLYETVMGETEYDMSPRHLCGIKIEE